jgi:hypothetical protein
MPYNFFNDKQAAIQVLYSEKPDKRASPGWEDK